MIEPTGYTALDLIGFTDRGGYDPTANYVKNDIVTVGNTKWRCKVDDTTGVTPTEGANWTIYLESATSLAGMDDVALTSPKNGDGLVHDGNDWKNVPIVTQEMQDILGAKNLFPNEATTQTLNGITFTVNADKSVTLNGTSTQAIYLILYTINSSEKNICKAGKRYKISGYNPADASLDWGYVYIVGTSAYSSSVALVSEFDGWEYDSTKYVYLFVREGKTLNNIIVKPMITIASQPNSDYAHYVPYAKTNRELTEDVSDISKRFANNFKFLGEIDASQIDNIGSTFFPEINTGSRCYYSFGYAISGTGECWVNGYEYKGGMYGFQIRYLFNGTVMKRYKNNSNTWSSWENV